MAIHAHSTTAPARPLLPLVYRPSAPIDDPRTADELLAEISAEIDRQEGVPKSGETPELPPEPLLPADAMQGAAGGSRHDTVMADRCLTPTVCSAAKQTPELGGFDIATPWAGDQPALSRSVDYPDRIGVVADAARTLHLRRQLAAAVDHGTELLAALGLPRLVGPDFIRHDTVAVGDALDLAIATLDALDGDTDREDGGDDEPSLGWRTSPAGVTSPAGTDDREQDTADDEPSLATPERHPTASHWTAPWSWVDTGPDSSQLRWAEGAQHDREMDDADGPIDDDELDDDGLSRGEGDSADDEPTLGAPAGDGNQEHWAQGPSTSNDPEADDADLEPDGERMIVRRPLGLCEPGAPDLVARAKAMRSGIVLPGDGFVRPWLAADRVFGLHVEGDCCAPEILNHGAVHVDKEAEPKPGDFVAFWFEAERAGRRVLIGWVKRLVMGLPRGLLLPVRDLPGSEFFPMLVVESLNPPRRYTIDARRVHALFKVVDVIPPVEAIAARQQTPRASIR